MKKTRSKLNKVRPDPQTPPPHRYRHLLILILASLGALSALYLSSRLAVSPTPADVPTATALPAVSPTLAPTPTITPTATVVSPGVITATPTLSPTANITPAATVALSATLPNTGTPPVYTYEIVQVYPHDPAAFTQGLLFDQGALYEGTGLNGRSSLRKVELSTGKVLQQVDLPAEHFGEGITIFGDQIYQLTWQSQVGFVYDKNTLAQQREFTYPTDGWGITHDGTRLIMSDGTPRLYFRDPSTFAEIGTVDVSDPNGPVAQLNELEYVQGEIYANIWLTDRIARIDPASGQVVGWIDLTGLLPPAERAESGAVLNGIAYLADEDRLFVTGKLWPKLFEIKLIRQP